MTASAQKEARLAPPHQGLAWLALTLSLAVHVTDEALTGFLPVYNDAVHSVRQKLPFLPIPTFTFRVWLIGLILGVLLLLAITPLAFARNRWIRLISYPLGIMMLGNGLLHIAGSIYTGTLMPGVYSAPLLLVTSSYLLWSVWHLRKERASRNRPSGSPKSI